MLANKCNNIDSIVEFASYPQVAIVATLRHIETGLEVMVCTTHICAEFRQRYIQVMQVQVILETINNPHMPVIFAGDFNSTPDTGICSLIRNGSLPKNHPDLSSNGPKLPYMKPSHKLSLESAYQTVLGRELITNYTLEFKGTLDYIWYSKNYLEPLSVFDGLPLDGLTKGNGFPNSKHPSDHIPLVCRFKFK